MDLLLPWSFSRTSTASLNAWTTCITHTSSGISSRSELSSKTIDKYSLRLKTKEVVKYSLRTILSKQAIRKKRLPLVMVVKTLLILHCKVIYFCLKELLLVDSSMLYAGITSIYCLCLFHELALKWWPRQLYSKTNQHSFFSMLHWSVWLQVAVTLVYKFLVSSQMDPKEIEKYKIGLIWTYK